MLIEISALIAALAFAVLVIFISYSLISLRKTMENLSHLLLRLEIDSRLLIKDVSLLLDRSTKVVDNVEEKMENLDPLFKSVSHIGEYTEHITSSLQHVSDEKHIKHDSSEEIRKKKILNLIDWLASGLILFQKFKKGEKSEKKK